MFVGYFNACDAIYKHNKMCKYDLSLNKYTVTQSDYFRLATTVTLGMSITDTNILFCHCILDISRGKIFFMMEYNVRTVYE